MIRLSCPNSPIKNKIVQLLLIDRPRYTNKTYYNIQADLAEGYFVMCILSYADDERQFKIYCTH